MAKKTYRQPELKSLKIDLGVFGSYGSDDGNDGGCDGGGSRHHGGRRHGGWDWWNWQTALPAPVPSVLSLNLKMK